MRSSVLVSSSLQLLEVLAGPQHRVGLGDREQPAERLRQLVLLRGLLGRAGAGLAAAARARATSSNTPRSWAA